MIWLFGNGARADAAAQTLQKLGYVCHRVGPGIDVNAPEFMAFYRESRPYIGIVAGFPTIFKKELIEIPHWGTINLHAGRLPQYRGGSPLNWQMVAGEERAGVSIIQMTERLDAGPVIADTLIRIEPEDDIATLHIKANAAFGSLLLSVFDRDAASGPFLASVPQDERKACYWHQRNDADGAIDWRQNAHDVHNLVRAITRPYPGAHTSACTRRVWKTSLDCPEIKGTPGHVLYLQGAGPLVCCGDRAIRIVEMTGVRLKQGEVL